MCPNWKLSSMPTKYIPYYALGLCLCTSIESLVIKHVQSMYPRAPPSVVLVFLTELLKLSIFVPVSLFVHHYNKKHILQDLEEEEPLLEQPIPENSAVYHWTNRFKSLVYLIPAAIYAISNNLVYFALQHMSPALFTLLMGLKIPFTGMLAFLCLNKQMSREQWFSLFLIFVGTSIAMIQPSNTSVGYTITGILAVLAYSTCSASAAVFMEWMTQHVRKRECVFKQSAEFAFYSVLTNLIAIIVTSSYDWSAMRWGHVASMASMFFNGLATALVIKYGGSIPKVYSSSMASILTAALSYLLWHRVLGWNYWVGALMCVLAVDIYARNYTLFWRPQ